MSASILGDMPNKAVPSTAPAEAAVALDPLSAGYITFGLTAPAYARLWPSRDAMTNAELMSAARTFSDAGDFRSSLYFIGALGRKRRHSTTELQMY